MTACVVISVNTNSLFLIHWEQDPNINVLYHDGQICGGCSEMKKLLIIIVFLCLCLCVHLPAANIVIQTEPATTASTPGSNVSRFNTEQDNRKRTMGSSTAEGPAAKKPWMEK